MHEMASVMGKWVDVVVSCGGINGSVILTLTATRSAVGEAVVPDTALAWKPTRRAGASLVAGVFPVISRIITC